jgi:hypothetical protein
MGRRQYDADQREKLDALSAIHLQRVRQRAALRLQVEAQLRDALHGLEIRESRAANHALSLGVTKTDIGRAIGTSNWETLRKLLSLSSGVVL